MLRRYDLQAGEVEKLLRARGYAGKVPAAAVAALARLGGERALIVFAARAFRDRASGAALLTHEAGHAYWDTLDDATRQTLRDLRTRELEAKTGPLFRDGQLQSQLAHVDEASERGVQEWFAERIARLNESWAHGRLDRADLPLLRRLAYRLREKLREIWTTLARRERLDPHSELFENRFREFFANGAGPSARSRSSATDSRRSSGTFRESIAREATGETASDSSESHGETSSFSEPDSGLADPAVRQDFHAALTPAAQAHPAGAIEVRSPEFYANPDTRLFLSADHKAGVAVSSDGFLVSAFGPSADLKPILAAAAEHATRAYAYAVDRGAMLRLYSDLGFRAAARARFDLNYAPSGWSTAALGKPDLVFMVKDIQGRSGAVRIRGAYDEIAQRVPMAKSHDQALRWQAEAVRAATIAPVSHALEVKVTDRLKASVDLAIAAIDSVHRDGALPRITVEAYINAEDGDLGRYDFSVSGRPMRILINDVINAWPAMTALHEVGHFLDHWVLGKQGKYASHSHPQLQAFRDVVDNSQAVKRLRLRSEANGYLLLREELWARAYAQYIARKSGDPRLLEQVETIRKKTPGRQWDDEDFGPIEKVIDRIFQKKGWLE